MSAVTDRGRFAELTEALGGLGIPIYVTERSGPYRPGINLWRWTSPDLPSRTYPYRGIAVTVMYEPQTESEERHAEWFAQVRETLLAVFPDRYRPTPDTGSSLTMIEDPRTPYARWRAAENAKRARLGFAPLHEIGH